MAALRLRAATPMARFAKGHMELVSKDGESIGMLPRVERKSSTLGKKPPAGARVPV